jgi:large subunit ribosomal protein L21
VAYAVIRSGESNWVAPGEIVRVPSISGKKPGDSVEFADVLVSGDDNELKIGAPLVDGARVTGTVVGQGRADKVIVFKFKRRKQYKRKQGHRQGFTSVKIDSVG